MRERIDELAWLPMAPGDVATVNTVGDGEPVAVEVELPARSVGWLEKTESTLVELIRLGARVDHLAGQIEALRTAVAEAEIERLETKLGVLRAESESAKPHTTATMIPRRLELSDRERIIKRFYGGSEDDN